MRTKKILLTLTASFAAVTLFAEPPPILFQDDFETPEEDGTPSLSIWAGDGGERGLSGVNDDQWVRVSTEDSESYFGEPDNGYLHIYGSDANATSLTLRAQNAFQGSNVISIHFDYHRAGTRTGSDPGMRVGRSNPIGSNNSARQMVRFQHNAISNHPVVENDTTYSFQMVYNNTSEPVTYLDGEATVSPDSYDIWIDGIRVITNGQYGLSTTGVPLGDPITSFGIGSWGAAHTDFRMDNLVIYDGAYAVGETPEEPEEPEEPEGPIIFADDFSESTPYASNPEFSHPLRLTWNRGPTRVSFENGHILEVTDHDSETFFGEANNPYLRFFHEGRVSGNFHMTAADAFKPTSEVITLSFDFYEPSGIGDDPLEILPGIGTAGTSNRIHKLELNNGAINDIPGLYQEDTKNNIQVIYNNSAEDVTYLDGTLTVPSDTFDLWLNGHLVMRNATYERGGLAVGTPLSSTMFILWGRNPQEIFLDNIQVLDHAHVENPASLPTIFADDFSNPMNGQPNFEIWSGSNWPFVESPPNLAVVTSNENSESYFGREDDNYMRMVHDGSRSGDLSITAIDVLHDPSPVVTISFDFFETVDSGNTPLRLRAGTGSVSDSNRIHELTFSKGTLGNLADAYQVGIANNIQVVMNNSSEEVPYYEAHIAKTVASDTFDVWLNGDLVLENQQSGRGTLALGTAISSIQFLIRGGANEFLFDNVEVFGYATAHTSDGGEPGDGITFAEWAANLPEGFRGPEDSAAGDGISNLVKFALGLDPLAPSRDGLPLVSTVVENGSEQASLTFQRFTGAADVSIAVEVSENLIEWDSLDAEIEILETIGDIERVRVIDTETAGENSRRFLRLNISQN